MLGRLESNTRTQHFEIALLDELRSNGAEAAFPNWVQTVNRTKSKPLDRFLKRVFQACTLTLVCGSTLALFAEQMVTLENYEVHYSVVNSTFLQPDVAESHEIVRAENQAVITISVLHEVSIPVPSKVSGTITNLLSQKNNLQFKLIEEGSARYYLASFRFTSEELLTFDIHVHDGQRQLSFQFKQKVFATPR